MSGSTLLAFDFDGTLAPIREDPSAVRIDRAAAVLLEQTTQTEGIVVAVVSGRDADDLTMRVQTPGAYIVASHGLEVRAPGGSLIRDTPRLDVELPPELREDIEASGLRLEVKKHGLALHWRGLVEDRQSCLSGQAGLPVLHAFRQWARERGLDVIEGRCVVEARCHGGGKEEALRWLTGAVGAARVVYAGDDITDFGALRFASERGVAYFVTSSEREPPPGVTVVGSFRELFRLIREEVMI